MPGRHASPEMGPFLKDLGVFVVKVVFWGAVVFGAVLLLPKVMDWFSTSPSTTAAAQVGGGTTVTTATTVLGTTVTSAPSTTKPPTPTTTKATSTTKAQTTTTAAPLPPDRLLVQVLNSTSKDGIAASLSTRLSDAGYQTVEAANYQPALDTSHIWYAPGLDREAAQLAAKFVPDAVVEEATVPQDVDILIVLGSSYGG